MISENWAVVTGAANGIGRAVTLRLVAKGIRVLAIDQDATNLASLKENIVNADCIRTFHTDLKDLNEDTLNAIDDLMGDGRLKYIVQNAAYIHLSVFGEITKDFATEAFAVNVIAPLLLAQHFAEKLHESKGRVLHIGNRYAHTVCEGLGLYITSRCAFYKLHQQLKEEWKEKGAQVGSVVIGAADTESLHRHWKEGTRRNLPVARHIEQWIEERGGLLPPATVAEQIVAVLLDYSDDDFSREEISFV